MTKPSTGSSGVQRTPRRAARWWLAAGTFVVGLAAGVIISGLLVSGSASPIAGNVSPDTVPLTTVVVGSTASSAASSSGASVQIIVNQACLRAINEGQDAYDVINKLGDAVRNFNLTTLDDIIRQLQPLQGALRGDISDCHVTARLPDGSLISTALPTASSALTPSVALAPTTTG